jgi:hypothetical protein
LVFFLSWTTIRFRIVGLELIWLCEC